jgi:hypothetical protein
MDKKIDNLTKYHLCSDHFSDDAFQDPKVNDKSFLKLNKFPSIPIPTIFENNLLKNVAKVAKNPEKFVGYNKHTAFESPKPEHEVVMKRPKLKLEAKPTVEIEQVKEEYLDEELEIEQTTETIEPVDINTFCRLCAKTPPDLISIFDRNGDLHSDTKCFRLMPEGIIAFNDGLPQNVCFDCVEKLQSCFNIIDTFVENQNMFVTE